METYNSAKVGKSISQLGWNSVYHYGTEEVIKFPKLEMLFGSKMRSSMQRDIRIGKEYFGEYMLEARVAESSDHRKSALIQPFVRGRVLQKSDLANPSIAKQFADIIERHKNLVSSGYAGVDLMSGVGFLFGTLRNIFLLEDNRLCVVDVMLLDMLHRPLYRFAMWRQEQIIKAYKGLDFIF